MAKKSFRLSITIFILASILTSVFYKGADWILEKTKKPFNLELVYTFEHENTTNVVRPFKNNIVIYEDNYIKVYTKEGQIICNILAEYKKPFILTSNNLFFTGDKETGYISAKDEKGNIVWDYEVKEKIKYITNDSTGNIALITESENKSNILVLNEQGKVKGRFSINKSSVVDMALSEGGEKVGLSILEIGSSMKSSTALYWAKGGLIGGQTYNDEIIPNIFFTEDDTLISIGDKNVAAFHKSGPLWKRPIDGTLKRVAFNKNGQIALNITREKKAIIDTKRQNFILVLDKDNNEQVISGVNGKVIDMDFIDENLFFCTDRTLFFVQRDTINKNKLTGNKTIDQNELKEKKINNDIKFIKKLDNTYILLGLKDKTKVYGIKYEPN
ncbi:DUF5711 family protein [Anaeromicrobium sediminis]|uniref:Uncharacterized protein n=1 Tax=Anaeromicrobium sediminis TaxID=1478221 RepID=A0A267MHW8_9FIRM|nr:DUF5711 family protein [Anaeromicrobium sediminis]PAB58465.1 hypothetical protein CCE28_15270 [Anaeromicrobium sediminis]